MIKKINNNLTETKKNYVWRRTELPNSSKLNYEKEMEHIIA